MYACTILINYRTFFFLSLLDWHNKSETNDKIKLGYCESICLLVPNGQHEFSFSFSFLNFYIPYWQKIILLPLLSVVPPTSHLSPPFPFFSLSPFRKRQASHRFEQSIAHQVEAGPSSSSFLKARQSNLKWGTNFQKPPKHQGSHSQESDKKEQPILLLQACKWPRLVPWRIPNCWSRVH